MHNEHAHIHAHDALLVAQTRLDSMAWTCDGMHVWQDVRRACAQLHAHNCMRATACAQLHAHLVAKEDLD